MSEPTRTNASGCLPAEAMEAVLREAPRSSAAEAIRLHAQGCDRCARTLESRRYRRILARVEPPEHLDYFDLLGLLEDSHGEMETPRAHLETCRECADRFAALRSGREAVEQQPSRRYVFRPSHPRWWQRLFSAPQLTPGRRVPTTAFAVGAVMLLAVLVTLSLRPSFQAETAATRVAAGGAPAAGSVPTIGQAPAAVSMEPGGMNVPTAQLQKPLEQQQFQQPRQMQPGALAEMRAASRAASPSPPVFTPSSPAAFDAAFDSERSKEPARMKTTSGMRRDSVLKDTNGAILAGGGPPGGMGGYPGGMSAGYPMAAATTANALAESRNPQAGARSVGAYAAHRRVLTEHAAAASATVPVAADLEGSYHPARPVRKASAIAGRVASRTLVEDDEITVVEDPGGSWRIHPKRSDLPPAVLGVLRAGVNRIGRGEPALTTIPESGSLRRQVATVLNAHPRSYLLQGLLYQALGSFRKARQAYSLVQRAAPGNPDAARLLQQVRNVTPTSGRVQARRVEARQG